MGRDIIVIGASAGGIEALRDLLADLPADFPCALFVVWHIPSHSLGMLPKILAPVSKLPIANATDSQPIKNGTITVAPPDFHMLLENTHVRLAQGPKENRFRPAIDPLFRSAAHSYGPRTIGVVLSGSLDDGTSGLWAIKDRGGMAIVQDPVEAMFPSMPESAIRHVAVDHVATVSDMAKLLMQLVDEPVSIPGAPAPTRLAVEVESAAMVQTDDKDMRQLGEVSEFTCPECHGSLWRIFEGHILRFRCRTGHAYTAETLLEDLTESVEKSLWASVLGLEENASLLAHMARHLKTRGQDGAGDDYQARSQASWARAQAVRRALEEHGAARSSR